MEIKHQKFCEVCGKPIPKKSERWPRYLKKKYCSYECRDIAYQDKKEVTCSTCGKVFSIVPSRVKADGNFCSYKCRSDFLKKGKTVNCGYCGKEIYVTRSDFERYKSWFCNRDCQSKAQVINKVEYKCEFCGKRFFGQRSHFYKYCSFECYSESKKTGKELVCDECGKTFYRSKKRSNASGHKYCSTKCARKSENTIERLLQNRRDLSSSERNKLEMFGEELLKSMNIDFKSQVGIGNYVVDLLLPTKNIIIELDGDYWHGNPKFFSEMDDTQKKTIIRDKIKNKYFQESGYSVLRFWEHDVYENTDLVKAEICNAILG